MGRKAFYVISLVECPFFRVCHVVDCLWKIWWFQGRNFEALWFFFLEL
jgi:hypothetical protein